MLFGVIYTYILHSYYMYLGFNNLSCGHQGGTEHVNLVIVKRRNKEIVFG